MGLTLPSIKRCCMALTVLLLLAGTASADTWLAADGSSLRAEDAVANSPQAMVTRSDAIGLDVTFDIPGLKLSLQKNKAGEFATIDWPEAAMTREVGLPALPVVRKLFVVPQGATVTYTVQTGEPVHVDLATLGYNVQILPAQAPIEKIPGAKENAPFVIDETVYALDAELNDQLVTVEELGIVRGQRLFMIEAAPVNYNPAAGTLQYYPQLSASISFSGATSAPQTINPMPGMKRLVLNPEIVPSAALRGTGNYLIVCASAYQSGIAGFAAAKTAQGFNVTTYVPTSASNTAIKSYISSLWGGANSPDYILLVGDTNTIPSWTGGGEGSPDTDLQYGCMDGSSDWYPDIPVGRFSVRNASQLQAIVDKTLYYENGPLADPDYLKRAVFMASEDNYSVSEGTHNWVISNHMAPNEIVCDKLYCHTYNATTQQVRNAFNAGRFFGIYSGHGGTYSWADGPAFSQSDVNGLTNGNMYPFVLSFACVTGTYTVDECFTETWSRASGKGAITIYGSSVNSYWTEDDVLEKRVFDSIYDVEDDVVAEVGPVWVDALMRFLAEMGADATSRRYFEMYNLMGDPSLRFPGACSDAGNVALDSTKYRCESAATIKVGDCGLNVDDAVIETVTVTITSTTEPAGEQVVLTETDFASAEFSGLIIMSETDGAGMLAVSPGDLITVTYNDDDDGSGNTATVMANANIDCTDPTIYNIRAEDVEARSATVAFNGDEPVRGTVYYGTSCGSLNYDAGGSGYQTAASVSITGLQDNTTYYYSVYAEDEAGNWVMDDNSGVCYSFATPEIPDFFTELFEDDDNDLDNWSIQFSPNGSNDFYASCAEEITDGLLPTDPSGGVNLTFGDDEYKTINLTGGETVSLYGVSYGTFYPCSNGYISFVHGEDGYNEGLEVHFGGVPQISALFDDLDPRDGGTISWKQMSDRVAVTWENIQEHSENTNNTFQIVMYFNGDIELNYLSIAAEDGLAGLSEGTGIDDDYMETDLTAMGNCGPKPPRAQNCIETTACGTVMTVTLQVNDDGLPVDPGMVTCIIESLPAEGQIYDPKAGLITTVPYALPMGSNQLNYDPKPGYEGPDSFFFKANDGGVAPYGGDSNTATVDITVGGSAWTPVAYNVSSIMAVNEAKAITLNASDPNYDPLTYYIESLPARGLLSDPGAGFITSVPYALADGGRVVTYVPPCGESFSTPDAFTYSAADATAASNVANISPTVVAGGPRVVYEFTMDTDPGWETEGLWAYGIPAGMGTHHQDPTAGYTGEYVYGYNLYGDYQNNKPTVYSLTTTPLNCSSISETELRFRRWLAVERFDGATVEVSANGVDWTVIWENPEDENVDEEAWSLQSYDISAVADGQEAVQIRWTMGPADLSTTFPGWNIDDVRIRGLVPLMDADFNGDGLVSLPDFQILEGCLTGPDGERSLECTCIDLNGDGAVDLADFAAFQAEFVQ